MNIQGLISELYDIGYALNLEGENIRFSYASEGTPPGKAAPLLSEVRLHKQVIIDFLKKELFRLIKQTLIEINDHWEPGALEWMKRTRPSDFKKMVASEEQINQLALSGDVNTLKEVLISYTGLMVGVARTFKTQRGETRDLIQRGTGDSGQMKPKAYQSLKTEESSPQTRLHAFREPILCRGIDCEVQFLPKRKDQVFCSRACRSEYFKVARGIGVALLNRSQHDTRMKVIVDGLLDDLKNPL